MSAVFNQRRILVEILTSLRPHFRTDRALPARIQAALTRNRSFGSRDRRLYRELIYAAVRYLPSVEPLLESNPDRAVAMIASLAEDSPITRAFRAAFAGDAPAAPDPVENLPSWFRDHCPALFDPVEAGTILRRASLWLRAQAATPEDVVSGLASAGIRAAQSGTLPTAIEVLVDFDVTKTDLYLRGGFEIQDLGSQMVLESVEIAPGGRWLDACAGAGGKTLQLAALLGAGGHVDAFDIRGAALAELRARADRSGVGSRIRIASLADLEPAYDGVLLDVPCSGSGTWRRSPHLKWTTSPEAIDAAAALQAALIRDHSARVAPGGHLVYATCSLSHRENEDVVAALLGKNAEFKAVPFGKTFGFSLNAQGLTILPARHNTDGFFVASLMRA